MLKALFFGVSLVFSAIVLIAATAIVAVLFLFAAPANTAYPVYLLESVEEQEKATEIINTTVEEIKPVFLLEVTEEIIEEQVNEEIDLSSLTIPRLKELAKEKGIHVKSSLRKAQIIELLLLSA